MPDFRVSDTAPEHPKLRAAGLAAAGLWSMAGGWCMQPTNLTDGWVPHYWVATWPGGQKAARQLVKVGLWTEEARDGVPGFQYHDWSEYQRTRAKVAEEQAKARDRMRAVRSRPVRTNTTRTMPVDNSQNVVTEWSRDHSVTTFSEQSTGDSQTVDNPTTSAKESMFGRTSPERSPNVHDSLTLTLTHGSSGEGKVTSPGARRNDPPPPRCPEHLDEPSAAPCGPCADARRAKQAWQAHDDAEQDAARTALALELAKARADPRLRCQHGTDGGRYTRPDTGTSPCALCRAEQTREPA